MLEEIIGLTQIFQQRQGKSGARKGSPARWTLEIEQEQEQEQEQKQDQETPPRTNQETANATKQKH